MAILMKGDRAAFSRLNSEAASSIIGRTSMAVNNVNDDPGLKRVMSLWDATLLVIGSVIGSGIFMTTGLIVGFVGSPGALLLVWLVGGLITLFGALTFGELAAMFPRAGGQFVYLKEAYGRLPAFLFGWAFFWMIMGGGIAALAVGFSEYLGYFLPALSNHSALGEFAILGIPTKIGAGQVVAAVLIGALSALNYFGLRGGLLVQNVFSVLRIGGLAAFLAAGWLLGEKAGLPRPGRLLDFSGGLSLEAFGLALFAALWTYDGWYSVNCAAGEIRNPRTNLPLSLVLGTAGVTAIYVLTNILYLAAVPVSEMSGVVPVGELAASAMFGPAAARASAGAILVSVLGCLSATILYGPRVYYAMADDGLFFRKMGRIHPRYHVPGRAIVGQGIWSGALCLTGTYQALFEYVIFALVFFFAATGAAVIVLRRTRPGLERPYRVFGYPVVPIIFIIINLAIFANRIVSEPSASALGLAMILAGLPAYFFWDRRRASKPINPMC